MKQQLFLATFQKTPDGRIFTQRMTEKNIVDAAEEVLMHTGETYEHAAGISWCDLGNGQHVPERVLTEEEYFPLAIGILKKAYAIFTVSKISE